MKICAICNLLIAVLLGSFLLSSAWGDVVVVVHKNNPVPFLSARQISDFYLGRRQVFPNGDYAYVLEHPRDCELRQRFYQRLNGMSLTQVNTYWARLMFSGRMLPPPELEDSMAVIKTVAENVRAIGYVEAEAVDHSVREVLRFHE